jgi:hypothetical protein
LLVEAFPAAQLATWGLTAQGYDRNPEVRSSILEVLAPRLKLPGDLREKAAASADALDAILCAFAAIAVTEHQIRCLPPADTADEGWIAVHC